MFNLKEIILESNNKSSDIKIVFSSIPLIYSHMMKFVSIRPILSGWAGTIFREINNLQKVTSNAHWNYIQENCQSDIDKAIERAISTYLKENPRKTYQEAQNVLNHILEVFPPSNLRLLQNKDAVKQYLQNIAAAENNDKALKELEKY